MLFLDSASVDDALRAARLPFVGGLSLNPTLLARVLGTSTVTHEAFRAHLATLAEAIEGTLFVQTVSHETADIVTDAWEILDVIGRERAVIKIPYSLDGLRATHQLEREGIATCTTSVFTPLQAYVAATSGASWIAPYCHRITQSGKNGVEVVRDMGHTFQAHGLPCRMLVASIKSADEMEAVIATGARHVTVPLALLEEAASHPSSDAASARFREDLAWAQQQRDTSS